MGIVPAPGVQGCVVRARLFRQITVESGEPPELSTIDVYAALPPVQEEGIVEATLLLRVDDVGHTRGSLESPTELLAGAADFSQVGEWPKAQRVPCTGAAAPGEVCVPGGAFWMGHPYSGLHEEGADASESRLVVMSPFYVDLHEVTVGQYRASGLATLEGGSSVDPLAGPPDAPPEEGALTPDDPQFYCTYSDAPLSAKKSREDLPVNCISWVAADAYCAAQGKRLPSEAEFEYVASALRSELFVWGTEANSLGCADGVWERAGLLLGGYDDLCRPHEELAGPLPAGYGVRDRLLLGEREVLDLVGNVSEWTRDTWNRTSEWCWSGRSLLENPECDLPSVADAGTEGRLHTVKGSNWASRPYPAARRAGRDGHSPARGFRCVRPGTEP